MVGLADGTLWVVDLVVKTARQLGTQPAHGRVTAVEFAPSGDWFVTVGSDPAKRSCVASIWRLDSVRQCAPRPPGPRRLTRSQADPAYQIVEMDSSDGATSCIVTEDCTSLIVGSDAGVVRVYALNCA